jgi:hypothetical protein
LIAQVLSGSYAPNPLTLFPYPNYNPKLPNKLRTMAVVSIADLALLRIDGGHIAEITDPLI